MKVIIAGSRTITDFSLVEKAILRFDLTIKEEITEIICGGARGIDILGRNWAQLAKVPIKMFPPDWDVYGKSAGFKRNKEMVKYANAAIVIWDGFSKGSKHTIDLCIKKGIPLIVYNQSENIKWNFYPKRIENTNITIRKQMQFKDLKIGQRFYFRGDLKIYTKSSSFEAERFLQETSVFGDTHIILAEDDEQEDDKAIAENSAWEQLRK